MKHFRLAVRLLRREWRGGELTVLALAIVVAVAAVSSVGFFTDRIQQALQLQANELLGADLVLNSDRPLAERHYREIERLGLSFSEQRGFPSMVMAEGGNQLAMIKAVDASFPLRGSVRIADAQFGPERSAGSVPQQGTVWLEPRLMSALGLSVGERLNLGEREFEVAAVLTAEPGRGGDLFNIAPRVLINLRDLPSTQLIQPASRVFYSLLVAGEGSQVAAFRKAAQRGLERGVRIQGIEDARPEVRTALGRSQQFLGLAAMTSVMLAGVAVALAARRYARRHLDHVAIMRCLGMAQGGVMQIYVWQMTMLGLLASLAGCLLGYLAHGVLVEMLGSLLGVELPPPSTWPLLGGVMTGLVTLLGFALPPLLQLGAVTPLRVLRRDLGRIGAPGLLSYGLGLLAISTLLVYQAGEVRLGLFMVAGLIATLLLLAALAGLVVWLLGRMRASPGDAWRYGLVNVARRGGGSVVQIVAFSLGIGALLLLTVIRGDLLDEWQGSLPDDAPNRFLINIQAGQLADIKDFFQDDALTPPAFYPMIRGRLLTINGESVKERQFDDERSRHLAEREFNLSWSAELAEDNRVVAGHWWQEKDHGQALLSVEQGIARSLNITLGDELEYDVAGQRFIGRVTSLREVDWDSLRANFFVLAVPGFLDDFPASYMTAFYLPADRYETLNRLVRQFPNVTVIDIAAIMRHVRSIIDRVSLAVEYVFLFTLLAGLMVLYAGIQSTHDERLRENAILRTLGGRRRQMTRALAMEFVCLGLLAGGLAALVANGLAWLLALKVLNMAYQFNGLIWLYGLLGGALGVGLAGLWGSRSVTRQPPLQVLQKV